MENQFTPDKLKELVTTTQDNVYELTQNNKVLLVFLRMFACPYCRKAVNDVNEIAKSLKQLNVKVVFVHQGPEEMASQIFNQFGSNLIRPTLQETTPPTSENRYQLPFYEIVDPECKLYHLFDIQEMNVLNAVRKEGLTIGRAVSRWGTSSRVTNVNQLGAFFVLDQGGEVFSSLRQQGQTNVHDIAELVNVRQDVRFHSDHTKQVFYRKKPVSESVCNSSSSSSSNSSSLKSNDEDDKREEKENDQPNLSSQFVQIQERHQEYRDLGYKPIAEQSIYHPQGEKSKEKNEDEQSSSRNIQNQDFKENNNNENNTCNNNNIDDENNNNNNNNNENINNENQDRQIKSLPQPVKNKRSLFNSFVQCSIINNDQNRNGSDDLERPYTEEEIKSVLDSWNIYTVLENVDLLPFFKTFCTKELSVENVLFYQSLQQMKNKLSPSNDHLENVSNSSMNEIYSDVKTLIDEYLLETSDNVVNVDESLSEQFLSILKQIENEINLNNPDKLEDREDNKEDLEEKDSEVEENEENEEEKDLQEENNEEEKEEKIISKLQNCIQEATDEITLNMMDPFSRFTWSVEGQRAAIFSIIQN